MRRVQILIPKLPVRFKKKCLGNSVLLNKVVFSHILAHLQCLGEKTFYCYLVAPTPEKMLTISMQH